jgi:hypothetical protein
MECVCVMTLVNLLYHNYSWNKIVFDHGATLSFIVT